MSEQKKVIFSGVQPSGLATLGNYIGAFKNWKTLQDEYNCIYSIVDLHAITVRQDPAEFRKKIRTLVTLYLAVGLDPEKNIICRQSQIPAHTELAWILNCYTYAGELSRMTQFKEKSQKHQENINAGLYTYPVLMTADILLYQTDLVPVGEDQKQHLELARTVATRFNNIYGDVFKVPEVYIPKIGAKIMGLQTPTKKMSKSEDDNQNNCIYLLDDLKQIKNKIKRSVTDSENIIKASDEKPGITNLLNIYCSITGKSIKEAEEQFSGISGYGVFKEAVADAVVEEIRPIQERFNQLYNEKEYVNSVMIKGAEKANYLAQKTLNKVKNKIGLILK